MDSVEKLHEILQELTAQRTRLEARAAQIDELIKTKPENAGELALQIAGEAYREIVETGIEFNHALVETVIGVVEEGVGGGGEGELIGIEAEHYEVIVEPLIEHRDMLDALISGQLGDAEKNALLKKRAKTVAAIELVEELVLEDDEDDEAPANGPGGDDEA